MKNFKTLLIGICLVAFLFCQAGSCLTLFADNAKSTNVSLVYLVKLKKLLASSKEMRTYNGELDYNEDGQNNATDLVAIRRLLLGLPIEDGNVEEPLTYDNDGFFNKVLKP